MLIQTSKIGAGNRRSDLRDQRISVCTNCEKGIFSFHEYIWTSCGLVHKECEV